MRYFKPYEFNCKCGHCGLGFDDMDPVLLQMLDDARDHAGVPFKITSAVRCDAHNDKVGGSARSSHLKGLAVDIACDNSFNRFNIEYGLLMAGFKRKGVRKDFIHVDVDPDKAAFAHWLY
jgi:uncharacterized protein YcbK (DUF882 family)